MKKVTLRADETTLEKARVIAKSKHKTLNEEFRAWLAEYTAKDGGAAEFVALMRRLSHVRPGRKFSREEMNERGAGR